ncbi:MAG TPA: MerR family transcriptional regulator [Iamia sp.]
MNVAERSHLSIGEVLSLLQDEFPDVTISKIRFLESQGLLDPERTPSGYRKFYEADVRRLRWILTEQRDKFLPLKVIKDRLDDGIEAELAAPDPSGNGAAAAVPLAKEGEVPTSPAPPAPPAAAPAPAPAPAPPVADPTPAPPASPEPASLPIWMADAARAKVDRGRTGRPAVGEGPDPLATSATSVSLTVDEMLAASGLTRLQLASLEEYGLVRGHAVADDRYYDGEDLVIAQKSSGFLSRGIEARHLRMFKTAAEREAALLESLVMPLVKQRNAEGQQQAHETVAELAALGQSLRAAFLRAALSDQL